MTFDSSAWTGRPNRAGTPIDLLRGTLRRTLWPTFDCDDCIGMIEHGCYCAAYECVAPGRPAGRIRHVLRRVFG